jgi:hypothetical protein
MGRTRDIVASLGSYAAESGILRIAKLVLFYGMVFAFAVLVGKQIHSPHPRVIKLTIALILFWMTIRSSLPNAVAVLAFILPFSATTAIGPTSSLAIVLVFLVWMIRVALRTSSITWKTPVSLSLLAFVLIHVLSFYNAPGGDILQFMLKKLAITVSGVLLVYLLINFVTDERALRRVVWASMLSCAVIIALSLVELWYPTLRLIPWFTLVGTAPQKGEFATRWIGGPFRDGELLGEYMAVSVPLQAFMFSRSRSMPKKAFWAVMMVGALVTALATMHRMPLVSMSLGVLYMIFIFRKRMSFHSLVTAVLLAVITVGTMEFVLANYTPSGSVFKRIQKTEFYGVTPDSRRMPWSQGWERSMEHPWIGHGPHYDIRYTVTKMYGPHSSYLYYFYTIGAIGVGIFFWLLITLLRMSVKYMGPRVGVRSFSTDLLAVIHIQLIVFIVDAIKISYQRGVMYYLLCWLMFGMCAACYKVAGRQVAEARRQQRERLNERSGVPGEPVPVGVGRSFLK